MRRATLVAIVGVLFAACTADVPSVTLHLERPTAMALVCMKSGEGIPLEQCESESGQVLGLVINSSRGSITRYDFQSLQFLDDDLFIPQFTPTPVGTRPAVIVRSLDGKYAYIANRGSHELVRMHLGTLELTSQPLPGVPADLVDVGEELLVAMPDLARVVRVPTTESFGALSGLQSIPLSGGSPYSLLADVTGSVLYVGHADVAYVSVVDVSTGAETAKIPLADPCMDSIDNNGDGLVDAADWGCRYGGMQAEMERPADVEEPEPILLPEGADLPQCANGVDDDGDGTTDFFEDLDCVSPSGALEQASAAPVLARMALAPAQDLLYVLNVRDRTLVAIDTEAAVRIDVNAEGAAGANALFRWMGREDIHLLGVPTDVSFATTPLSGDDEGGQLLAYVSSATGVVFAFDVEDEEGQRVHWERDGDPGDTSQILTNPELFHGDERLDLGGNRRPNQPSFGEFIRANNYGVELGDDPRLLLNETWEWVYGGRILQRPAAVGAFQVGSRDFVTPEPVFCGAGVEVGDRLILRTQAVDATGCAVDADMDVDAYSFVITEVHQNRLVVGEESTAWLADGSQKAGPSAGSDCFPEATAYEVRVPDGVYAVKGSLSGFVHPVVTDESGACVVDASVDPMFRFRAPEWELASEQELEDCPPSDVDATAWFVHPDGGEAFHNHAFTARLIPGCEGSGTPEEPFRIVETQTDTTWKFFTDSAMTPRAIGGRGGGEPTMGNPRGLEWHRAKDVLYVIDAGQEKIVEIVPGQDNIRSQFF